MAIVQDAFSVPDDIVTGLATGLYRRIGSVVRYAVGPQKGQIVKHLQPIDIKTTEQAQSIGVKTLHFCKQHKKGTIIVAISSAAIGTSIWVYNKIKRLEPKTMIDFRNAMRVYIDAIRTGNLDLEKIQNMLTALDKLKRSKHYDSICIMLTADELDVLVTRIYEYTIRLAKDNGVQLAEDRLSASNMKITNTIINLQHYLEAQEEIFAAVA